MDEDKIDLISEQLEHMKDNFDARFKTIEADLEHHTELEAEKHKSIDNGITELKTNAADHEARIRTANDSVTGLRTWTSLFNGSAFVASMAALIRSFLGG
jgi:predicted nuclease with TOPRIM domain